MGSQGKDGLGAPITHSLCKVYKMSEEGQEEMSQAPKHGLLIDYEYCTGCHTCEVACAQEYQWPGGMGGMKVMEVV